MKNNVSTFKTKVYVYDPTTEDGVYTEVDVEYIYQKEWPSTEYDPGEPELLEICSVKVKDVELTEENCDIERVIEQVENNLREYFDDYDY